MRVVTVHVDRDSVAMGDDVVSHARTVELAAGTPLSELLDAVHPEIRAPGWSWVASVDRRVSAVWSVDHGVRLLVPDEPVGAGEVEVHFRYFVQIDPQWLHARLAAGARPDRSALEAEYAPVAHERREAELRRREREVAERYLSEECLSALTRLGASIELHADTLCRFTLAGERWTVARADTMTQVYVPGHGSGPVASLRPRRAAEVWLVAAVGAAVRERLGMSPVPEHEPRPGPELTRAPTMWSATGPLTVQVRDAWALAVHRFAQGRTVAEVVEALGLPPRAEAPRG